MPRRPRWRWTLIRLGGLLGVLGVVWAATERAQAQMAGPAASQQVPVELRRGEALYATHCAECHGPAARGTDRGPTFLSKTYSPYLHADIAFQLAVQRGVRAHHGRFSDMPKIPEVSREDVRAIVEYVRRLQREAGVY